MYRAVDEYKQHHHKPLHKSFTSKYNNDTDAANLLAIGKHVPTIFVRIRDTTTTSVSAFSSHWDALGDGIDALLVHSTQHTQER